MTFGQIVLIVACLLFFPLGWLMLGAFYLMGLFEKKKES